jgi:hypothetical protein
MRVSCEVSTSLLSNALATSVRLRLWQVMSLLYKVRTRSERIDSMWGVLEDTVSLLRSHKVCVSFLVLRLRVTECKLSAEWMESLDRLKHDRLLNLICSSPSVRS